MIDNPLVSVVVLTYNSSNTVLETLDSIAAQTYKNIELIISDDCSKDDTVKVCEKWLEENRERFVVSQIITSDTNTGITGNANRAFNAARGLWIKGIAGDDILLPECIEKNVEYIINHPNAKLVFSKIIPFGNKDCINQYQNVFLNSYGCLLLNDRDFFYLIRLRNFLPASSSFINKSLFSQIGGYDESIPMLEDWPFWIKVSYNKIHFHFMPIETVKYRMHLESISIGKRCLAYIKSEKKALEYAMNIQKKTNTLLWFLGICNQMRKADNVFIKNVGLLGKLLNPISYYIKYIEWKANKLIQKM